MLEWELYSNTSQGREGLPSKWEERMCTICISGRDKQLEHSERKCALGEAAFENSPLEEFIVKHLLQQL